MSKPFKFKQFSINQDKATMKVGTDGVLLGAWVSLDTNIQKILDIGSGTGVIGLMLAQRHSEAEIDAIEIEENAYEQSVENFENSDWNNRLFCYNTSLKEFQKEVDEKYDLIISNPPFYNSTFKDLEAKKAIAKHTISLTYSDLLNSTSKLLSTKGTCAFIIPYDEESNFIEIAKGCKLYPKRITRVKGNKSAVFKRSLIQFSIELSQTEISELTIEIERHVYTAAYKKLVQDFYLKM